MSLSILQILAFTFFTVGILGGFIGLFIGVYVAKKWMVEVTEILEDGFSFYTTGIVFGFLGLLQYATVFFWSFHAKRYGMLEKRENVPKHIQKWFITAYCVFMLSAVLAFTGCAIILLFLDKT